MSISQNFPEEGPTLNLNFAGSKTLDPRITFSRTSTGTYMDDSGLIKVAPADSPRFDHRYVNGEIESLGLLVEEERSNLLLQSEDFSTTWIPESASVSANQITAPDGNITADKLVCGTGTPLFQGIVQSVAASAVVSRFSVYVKAAELDQIELRSFSPTTLAIFELSTQQVLSVSDSADATITDAGNGWYRCSIASYSDATFFRISLVSGGSRTFTPISGAGIYIWGAQLEEGAFPTSYIPTSGSTATRNHDRAVIEGSNFTDIFNTNFNNFSMFVNYDNTDTDDGTNYDIITFWGESTNFDNRIGIFRNDASPYHIETRAIGGGSAIFSNDLLNASSKAATQKLATSWSVDYSTSSDASRRWAFSFNGESVDVVNDGTGTTIPSLTRIGFGKNPTRTDFDGGKIHFKQISLYSNTLTDSQLQTLTK